MNWREVKVAAKPRPQPGSSSRMLLALLDDGETRADGGRRTQR